MKVSKQTIVEKGAEWLLLAVLFLLPWQTRWIAIEGSLNKGFWEYGTVSVYVIDILIAVFLIFAGAHFLAERKAFKPSLSQLTAGLLLAVAFFSMAFAGNRINTLFWFVKLAEGVALFWLIPALRLHRSRIALALIASGGVQSLLAYCQFISQKVVASKWLGIAGQDPSNLGVNVIDSGGGRLLRAYGALPHPNMLAGFLVISLLAGLALYMHEKRKWYRVAGISGMTITGTGLWLTLSRQGIIALGGALFLFVLYTFLTTKTFPRRAVAGVVAALLPLLVFSFGFSELTTTRLSNNTRTEHHSITERQDYLTQSTELLRTDWVAGVGIGNYTAELNTIDQNNDVEKEAYEYQPVHNVYLLLFNELGIFGLIVFICFLFTLIYRRNWKRTWAMHWAIAVIGLLLIGMLDHYLWSLHFGILLFWLTAALYEHTSLGENLSQKEGKQ